MSNVTNSPRVKFLLAFGLILSIMVAGTVGPASDAWADGGGGDTIIIKDSILGSSSAPNTMQEVVAEWALKLLVWSSIM